MTGTGVGNAFAANAPKPLESRAGKFSGGRTIPFVSKAEAFTDTVAGRRTEIGLRVAIGSPGVEGIDYKYFVYQRASTYPTGGDSADGWDLVEEPIQYVQEFGVLVGDTWDIGAQPKVEQTLTADTDFSTIGGTAGKTISALLLTNPGTFVVTVNGEAVNIRNGGDTFITAYRKRNGTYFVESSFSTAVADTINPAVTSVEAVDPHTIEINFDGVIVGSFAGYGFSFDDGSPLTDTAATGFGTNKLTVTITETMADTDVITYGIVSSDIEDLAGNSLQDTVTPGSVINSISPVGLVFLNLSTQSGAITESPTHQFNIPQDEYMVFAQSMAANGAIEAEVPSSLQEVAVLGLDEDNTLEPYSIPLPAYNWKYYIFLYLGNYHFGGTGASSSLIDTGIPYVAGQKFGLYRSGTTVKGYYNTGGSNIDLTPTFTTGSSATLYGKAQASVAGVKLLNPKGQGFA